nr:4Fe-4S binding protein [Anaerolineae bacterium]
MIVVYILAALVGILFLGILILWMTGERGHLFGLPSTRAAISGADGQGRGLNFKTIHGYFYGRWPEHYIGWARRYLLPRMDGKPSGLKWADHYHGKVVPLELAKSIITLDHDIPRTDLEQIIPYTTARDIVLKGPPDVVVMDCPCRLTVENPCEPIRVCMIIGDGQFVLDHRPDKANALSQQEALDLLQAEHERGHVHVAYFKDACGDKFYAICNCCSCCCGGIQAMRSNVPMVIASGYIAQFDHDQCTACGTCADACPFEAITVNGYAEVIYDRCMGCGVCVDQCDNEGITLVRDPGKGIPLDVREIG